MALISKYCMCSVSRRGIVSCFCMVSGMLTPRKPHLNSEIQKELKENTRFLQQFAKRDLLIRLKKIHEVPEHF